MNKERGFVRAPCSFIDFCFSLISGGVFLRLDD